MKDNHSPILIVAGPTASGKSDLAIQLARRFNGEIISADSRQVYRGMDIGTGKVTKREQKLARHWLLDVASPKRQYSVARFKRDAERAIRNITRRGKLPIICGGTGFWIDALVYGQSLPEVKPDGKLRAKLQKLSAAELFARLSHLDPARAAAIDRHNPVRLIRALEIIMTTGKPVPAVHRSSPYHLLYLGVSRPMGELKRRIEKRLDARLKAGMIAEVRRLHAMGASWKRLESFGLEYRWVARFLRGTITRNAMRDALLKDIIAYAKRQLTWWRKNGDIAWVASTTQAKTIARQIASEYATDAL
ncbi:MAG: tRNA (adenosine(37)-N6)-dimethylallyltransferase MiaA [Candidatus Yanofskybacteria bacterium]|nr:tRNA (adenosine(37)-N6)-dimethylallyltransferase MiaA [Candidatus Yanofskybacteria bacterium]